MNYIIELLDGRNMDDFYLISDSREYLCKCLYDITDILKSFGLKLNTKKSRVYNISEGIKFLGFKFILTNSGEVKRILLKSSSQRMHKKIKKWYNILINNIDPIYQRDFMLDCITSMESLRSHVIQGTNPGIIYQMDLYFYILFYTKLIENNISFLDYCYIKGDYEYKINQFGKEVHKSRNKRDLLWAKQLYFNSPSNFNKL